MLIWNKRSWIINHESLSLIMIHERGAGLIWVTLWSQSPPGTTLESGHESKENRETQDSAWPRGHGGNSLEEPFRGRELQTGLQPAHPAEGHDLWICLLWYGRVFRPICFCDSETGIYTQPQLFFQIHFHRLDLDLKFLVWRRSVTLTWAWAGAHAICGYGPWTISHNGPLTFVLCWFGPLGLSSQGLKMPWRMLWMPWTWYLACLFQWLGFEAACDGDIVDTNDIQQLDCILIHLLTADSELAVVESWAACLMNPVLWSPVLFSTPPSWSCFLVDSGRGFVCLREHRLEAGFCGWSLWRWMLHFRGRDLWRIAAFPWAIAIRLRT